MTTTSPRPACLTPDSRPLTADSSRLPPSQRDFEIYQQHVIASVSTRDAAERHGISQTRVRQIVQRVCDWLADTLPAKDEVERAKEARLAQHIAADRLQHHYGEVLVFWRQTNDPKYMRQTVRMVLALARLGIIPGTTEALFADVQDMISEADRDGEAPAEPNSFEPQEARRESRPPAPPSADCSPVVVPRADAAVETIAAVAANPLDHNTCHGDAAPRDGGRDPFFAPRRALLTGVEDRPVRELVIRPDKAGVAYPADSIDSTAEATYNNGQHSILPSA